MRRTLSFRSLQAEPSETMKRPAALLKHVKIDKARHWRRMGADFVALKPAKIQRYNVALRTLLAEVVFEKVTSAIFSKAHLDKLREHVLDAFMLPSFVTGPFASWLDRTMSKRHLQYISLQKPLASLKVADNRVLTHTHTLPEGYSLLHFTI